MTDTLYPKSPKQIDKKLTALPSSYQFKAFLAILSILLFFILYVFLVIALGYLVYYAIIYDMGRVNKITILLKIGAIAGSVMLFIFTLKFILKLKNNKPNNRITLHKKDFPKIWAFVYKICKETGAPKPKNIYVDPDVNAYVAYSNMWLSLFLPVKKELTLGMGLVSSLNLSEFKAVVAHEFGHFAQRSMKIGSYIISANTIIHDMIFSRDKWDDLLDQWRASDIRLSAAAWVITPVIWLIRQVLNLFYQFLNIMYSLLSREMEFNADKVAISTAGSDAIISALWQLDSGYANWNSTLNNAYLAAQKKIFVKNLYLHNDLAIARQAHTQQELLEHLPEDPRGGKMYFSNSKHSKVSMYASHPPNDKRQDNAKVPYIACDTDTRSPWLLFDNAKQLQERMTNLIYDIYFNKTDFTYAETDVFEQFIASENKGKDLLEAYDNTFENRFLQIPDAKEVAEKASHINLSKTYLDTMLIELKTLMLPIRELEKLMVKASEISQGITKDKSFAFKGQTYKKKNLQEGYNLVSNEREKLFTTHFKDWDTTLCAFHLALAKKVTKEKALTNLYNQHKTLTELYRAIVNTKNTIFKTFDMLQTKEDISQTEINAFATQVNSYFAQLNTTLDNLETIPFVKLPNIDNVTELKTAIVEDGFFKEEKGLIFENGGFSRQINSLENAIINCQRIDQKSIGVILGFHNDLHVHLEA